MLIPKRITKLPPAIAFRYISGLMMRPDDGAAVEEFKSLALAEGWLSDHKDEALTIPREVVQGLVDAAKRGVGKDLEKAEKPGSMAGNVLLYVLRGQASGIRDFGVDKAAFLVSEMWRKHREFQGLDDAAGKGAGRDTVHDGWKKYRSVAHLWTAYTALASPSDDPGDLLLPEQWAGQAPERFLALAQGVLVAASNCRLPGHEGRRLLDPEQCWVLEDINPEHVNFIPLREDEQVILKKFKPRFRD